MSVSARQIGCWLARWQFKRECLVVLPETYFPGEEADILAVTKDLRLIDIEIKISRSDFKADAHKEKWWHRRPWVAYGEPEPPRKPREWPPRIWKHYYCLPESVWKAELMDFIGSPRSGVLLISDDLRTDGPGIRLIRKSTPNKDAAKIEAKDCIELGRLASLRMWDAYDTLDYHRREREYAEATP